MEHQRIRSLRFLHLFQLSNCMFYRNADDILGSLISSTASRVVWWRKHTYVTSFDFFLFNLFCQSIS